MKKEIGAAVAGIIGGGVIWWMITGGTGVFGPSAAVSPPPVAPAIRLIPTSTPTQAPTMMPIPTSTSTPNPTHTPLPTSTPTQQATQTPIPTSTPTPTTTPLPTATRTPTVTVTPTVCGLVELTLMGAGKKHDPCYTPTPTPDSSANYAPASTVTAAVQATATTLTPAMVPVPTIAPLATTGLSSAMSTPVAAAAPDDANGPNLLHLEEKQFMLELINAERDQAGLNPVEMGHNIAAQLHSESALKNCFASHWGMDGLKPYMRYSLAGGYQSNAENGHGSDYCITLSDGYAAIDSVEEGNQAGDEQLDAQPGTSQEHSGQVPQEGEHWPGVGQLQFSRLPALRGRLRGVRRTASIENRKLSFSGTARMVCASATKRI